LVSASTSFCFYSFCTPRVLHSFPTRRSSDLDFTEWMARVSPLPVEIPEDGSALHAGTVYIATPGCHLKLGTGRRAVLDPSPAGRDRKSTRLNSSHVAISYAVFCLKKKKQQTK